MPMGRLGSSVGMGVVNCRRHRIAPAGGDALTAYTKPLLDAAYTTCRFNPRMLTASTYSGDA